MEWLTVILSDCLSALKELIYYIESYNVLFNFFIVFVCMCILIKLLE